MFRKSIRAVVLALALPVLFIATSAPSYAHSSSSSPIIESIDVDSLGSTANVLVALGRGGFSIGQQITVTAGGRSCVATLTEFGAECEVIGAAWGRRGMTITASARVPYSRKIRSTSVTVTPSTVFWSKETGNCTIAGTDEADVLVGTASADRICGLGGDDIIEGKGGNDVILGGEGNDALFGGAELADPAVWDGSDYLSGGLGDDSLNGGTGSNKCSGGDAWWLEDNVLDPATCRDVEDPYLNDLSFSTVEIDTSAGPQDVVIGAQLLDDLSGVGFVKYEFKHKASRQVVRGYFDAAALVSGDELDGWYEDVVTFPQGAAQGTWTFEIDIEDQAWNDEDFDGKELAFLGLPGSIAQTGVGTYSTYKRRR